MRPLDLVTVGRISLDVYGSVPGAGWESAREFRAAVGGSPANVAVAAARLGRRAAVLTRVGEDPIGARVRGELRDLGVDDRFAGVEPGTQTPIALAVPAPPDEPSLVFRRAAAPDLRIAVDEHEAEQIAAAPLLWISAGALSAEPSATVVERLMAARTGGAAGASAAARETILDLDYRASFWPSREAAAGRIGAAVGAATIAIGNREECAVATGSDDPREAADRLLARGLRCAVVKLGGDGVLLAEGERRVVIAPRPVEVVCGLGAGDAFGGAFCHALLAGWELERAVAFANAAGALVASRLLCSEAMPFEHEVLALLDGADASEAVR